MNTTNAVKRVGLIATGSEIISGEILNTNGQHIAQSLQAEGIEIGEHIVTDDQDCNLARAIRFMLDNHDAIMTTGGLGPTSDDRTRFVLSDITQQALIANSDSWQRIMQRLQKFKLQANESNRQQALFPQNAIIYANKNGTADGCKWPIYQGKHIYMLPGPPRECLPLFENHVLPDLVTHQFATEKRLYRWRLMGASESTVAEKLESELAQFGLTFAYRAAYPYLDIKLLLNPHDEKTQTITNQIYQIVQDKLVTTDSQQVSSQLRHALADYSGIIDIYDLATRGYLASQLLRPYNQHALNFQYHQPAEQSRNNIQVIVTGLNNYWQPQAGQHHTELTLTIVQHDHQQTFSHPIFLRGQESLKSAVEFVSDKIYRLLR